MKAKMAGEIKRPVRTLKDETVNKIANCQNGWLKKYAVFENECEWVIIMKEQVLASSYPVCYQIIKYTSV